MDRLTPVKATPAVVDVEHCKAKARFVPDKLPVIVDQGADGAVKVVLVEKELPPPPAVTRDRLLVGVMVGDVYVALLPPVTAVVPIGVVGSVPRTTKTTRCPCFAVSSRLVRVHDVVAAVASAEVTWW